MNEQDELGLRIARLLDESTQDIGHAQRERLVAARQKALAVRRPAAVSALVPAWVGNSGLSAHKLLGVRYLVPAAALVLGLAVVVYVNSNGNSSVDIADIDAGLLTDELPINAYLDQGFDSWLKRSSR